MAWRKLSVLISNNGGSAVAGRGCRATRAYQHRDRLPELEKQASTATYFDYRRSRSDESDCGVSRDARDRSRTTTSRRTISSMHLLATHGQYRGSGESRRALHGPRAVREVSFPRAPRTAPSGKRRRRRARSRDGSASSPARDRTFVLTRRVEARAGRETSARAPRSGRASSVPQIREQPAAGRRSTEDIGVLARRPGEARDAEQRIRERCGTARSARRARRVRAGRRSSHSSVSATTIEPAMRSQSSPPLLAKHPLSSMDAE